MKINLKNAKVIKSLKGFGGSACWWSPQIKDEKFVTMLQIFFTVIQALK